LVLVVPQSAAAIRGEAEPSADPVVGYDCTQAGLGDRVALSEDARRRSRFTRSRFRSMRIARRSWTR